MMETRHRHRAIQYASPPRCECQRNTFGDIEYVPIPRRKYHRVAQTVIPPSGSSTLALRNLRRFACLRSGLVLRIPCRCVQDVANFGVRNGLSQDASNPAPVAATVPVSQAVKTLRRKRQGAREYKALEQPISRTAFFVCNPKVGSLRAKSLPAAAAVQRQAEACASHIKRLNDCVDNFRSYSSGTESSAKFSSQCS